MVEILGSIADRDKKARSHFEVLKPYQVLILRTWKQTVVSELRFMLSFWGHECRYQGDKMSLWSTYWIWVAYSPSDKKASRLRSLKYWGTVFKEKARREHRKSMDRFIPLIFSFPLCPKSLKDRFLRLEFTNGFLKTVAQYGKIKHHRRRRCYDGDETIREHAHYVPWR